MFQPHVCLHSDQPHYDSWEAVSSSHSSRHKPSSELFLADKDVSAFPPLEVTLIIVFSLTFSPRKWSFNLVCTDYTVRWFYKHIFFSLLQFETPMQRSGASVEKHKAKHTVWGTRALNILLFHRWSFVGLFYVWGKIFSYIFLGYSTQQSGTNSFLRGNKLG